MKTQFIKFIPIAFLAMIVNTANAGTTGDSTSQANENATTSFGLVSNDTTTKNGIKGKFMISSGFGFNDLRDLLISEYNNCYANTSFTVGNSIIGFAPMINLGVDYGLGKKISVGAALGYQQVTINSGEVGSTGPYGFGLGVYDNLITDTWTRIQLAVRGDYYIIANDDMNIYTGLKVGYNNYDVIRNYVSNYSLGSYPNPVTDIKTSSIVVQAHLGYSYYFNKVIGLNTEFGLGIGTPNYFTLGLTFKI